MVSGLLALLKVERDKIGAAPYDGCLCTLVEGIKPFVVCFGVKVLITSFPARPYELFLSELDIYLLLHNKR